VCLLTGAGGLLGDAFCHAYSGQYDILAVCHTRAPTVPSQHDTYVDPLDPATTVAENAGAVYTVKADLEKAGEAERVVDIALARYGRVDLLVNNAAYVRLHQPGLIDTDGVLSDFERHFTLNVAVPLRLASLLAQRFWQHRDQDNRAANRNVVNVSSLSATRVYANQGQGVYSASKAALNHLTRHLAAEFGVFGVRVNGIAPNSFPSVVRTESVAQGIARLDQEQVTGKILAVDNEATG
jgi:NAD(P)-dependent dehydrogenase (short-subunit alcohol dehydrogenase family)